ncbi:MAG: hypothetical protein IKS43_00265 [Clostridia bacterium]|nr:hypothetical protein [Clostridia bacterium]
MKCAYCGKNNKEGALICKRCGMGLPVKPPEPEGRDPFDGDFSDGQEAVPEAAPVQDDPYAEKHGRFRKWLIAACAAVLAVIIAILLISLADGGNVIRASSTPYTVGTDAVIKSGEFIRPSKDMLVSAKTDIDGNRVGILTSAGELFFVPTGGDKPIARNVVSFSVSVDGRYMTYLDENGLLWSYNSARSDDAPVCICNEPVKEGYVSSPDGRSVLYRKFDDLTLYLWSGGKSAPVGEEGMSPIAVSDGGRHIYCYSDSENALYYIARRGRAVFLCGGMTGDVYLNSTHTQAVFCSQTDDGIIATKISVSGSEPVEILSGPYPVTPVLTASSITLRDISGSFSVTTCPLRSFDNVFFSGGCLLRYGLKTGVAVLEPSDCSGAVANESYSTVYYVVDGQLTKRPVAGASNPERPAKGVASFKISGNGSIIWFLDEQDGLHCLKGVTDEKIAMSVSDYVITPNGRDALFISAGRLCCNKNGSVKRTFIYDNVYALELASDSKGLYYSTLTDGWVKLSSGGRRSDLSF